MYSFIMLARFSVARARHTIIFAFLFSLVTLSQTSDIPKFSHMTLLSIQQNFCYTDFFKVPPKTNGGPKNPKFAPFFTPSRRQLAP